MGFLVRQDIESVLELTGLNIVELAEKLGVTRATIHNWITGRSAVTPKHLEEFYGYAYDRGIRLNKIKEQFYKEEIAMEEASHHREILLFHGAKSEIAGDLDLTHNKAINDFGDGFYAGESLEQSAMFVASYKTPSLYMLQFDPDDLKHKEFRVDQQWMLTVAYFRGRLNNFKDTQIVKDISESIKDLDYIVAPIADNRMYEIIDEFINGEITDVQCQHCLSATDLGRQYVFVSKKALANVTLLERCYLAEREKESYLYARQESYLVNRDKVKLARRQYRNQGDYIEDILK